MEERAEEAKRGRRRASWKESAREDGEKKMVEWGV